ncbi:hypothetical protein ACFCV3_22795 [Kribbella sp. NPDC056345]|uniref:hypothetical protein n=1 Tax=Kribbella sp. NPDC056345 TaxID=3345789 RepID=UPI0035D7BEBB
MHRATWRVLAAALAASSVAAGCSDSSKVDDRRPLPTNSAAGELVCRFVSKESLSIALGSADFNAEGDKRDAHRKNPDGSTLAAATCEVTTGEAKGKNAISVSVQPLGLIGEDDAQVAEVLASGRADFVFPAAEGMGFGASEQTLHLGAGVCDLIVGDWHYGVTIQNAVAGRNAVDDAVALTRQVVATLRLPKVGTKPRPTVSPSK